MRFPGLSRINSPRRHECPNCTIHVQREADVCVNCGQRLSRSRPEMSSAAPSLLLASGSVASHRILRG
jgi:hypothetical protein